MASTMSKRCERAGRGWVVSFSLLAPTLLPGVQEPLEEEPSEPPAEAPQDPQDAPADPASDVTEPASEGTGSQLEPHYRFLADRETIRSAWLARGGVEELQLGQSAGGRELFAVQFGGPGGTPLSERTTILLLGGLDGISFSGSEAVIAVTDALLANPDQLPPNATFVAVPWASPDGLARSLASGCGDGRNDRPFDDDRDGQLDEDGPDDLDGDGLILEMLIEDPEGPWARASDERFLRPARAGEAPRYRLTREGRDDDGDGRFNEDGLGGISLDHNFPLGWAGPWGGTPAGQWPLSEPSSRALAELVQARRTALVLVFQGNHGKLATPGGLPHEVEGALALPFASDAPTFGGLVELFARLTERSQDAPLTLAEARRGPYPGAAIDWFYAALGAVAMEIAIWGPDVDAPERETVDAKYSREHNGRTPAEEASGIENGAPEISGADRGWARWLDETRGGIGFVEWQPVDVGAGRRAWVGGWEPFQYAQYYLHGGREFRPDMVLVGFFVGNDAFDQTDSVEKMQRTARMGRRVSKDAAASPFIDVQIFLYESSHLARLILNRDPLSMVPTVTRTRIKPYGLMYSGIEILAIL